MSKKALVTGHAGFIGRHVARRLVEHGYLVTGIDVAEDNQALFTSLKQDVRDFFRRSDKSYDLVVHCAAVVGGRTKIEGAPISVAVDLAIDSELFQWALRTRPGRVVYFSSSAAYPVWLQDGDAERLWEDTIDLGGDKVGIPDLTYGWSKLTGELLARHVTAAGVPVHVFRPFTGYGTDQDLAYPFPSFIQRALRRDDPFEVWGDGWQSRDFIHVDDVVGAVLAAIDQDVRGPVNLCTGRETSFNELARLVTAAAGYSPQLKHLTGAPVGVQRRVGDATRMLEFYTPKVSLEDGIRRAIESVV